MRLPQKSCTSASVSEGGAFTAGCTATGQPSEHTHQHHTSKHGPAAVPGLCSTSAGWALSLPPLLPATNLYRDSWNSLAYQDLAAVSNFIGAYKTAQLSKRFTTTFQQDPLTLLDVPLPSSAGSASIFSVCQRQKWHLHNQATLGSLSTALSRSPNFKPFTGHMSAGTALEICR